MLQATRAYCQATKNTPLPIHFNTGDPSSSPMPNMSPALVSPPPAPWPSLSTSLSPSSSSSPPSTGSRIRFERLPRGKPDEGVKDGMGEVDWDWCAGC